MSDAVRWAWLFSAARAAALGREGTLSKWGAVLFFSEAGRAQGEKPADLPILRAVNFEFVINLQTAKRIGSSRCSAARSLGRSRRAQQVVMPVVGILYAGSSAGVSPTYMAAFRKGLEEAGFAAGQNVAFDFRFAEAGPSLGF